MSIGMTYNEYWHGDNYLPRYYLKAYKLKRQREDEYAWMQGRYIYEAIGALTPILNPLSKNPKPHPYVEKPYLEDFAKTEEEKAQEKMLANRKKMEQLAIEWNMQFAKSKRKEDD